MDARLFIINVDKDPTEAKRIAAESAKRIETRETKFLDLVQSLGEHLTDDDTTIRAKAIGYLAAVIQELGPKSLSRQQVPVITQFLCDRLDDETGLKETATGLAALTKVQYFGTDEATMVMNALVKVDLPKHPPTTRFAVLSLVDALMSGHRDALKVIGDTFVKGLADLIGGEKDPRNLMIVFSVVKVVLVEFDIVNHVELMFDVVYCYFPITFRPPPDDPYGITAQDLKTRLRECLASTHYFTGQIFPKLIEKLDSTSQTVKLDVLQTITACALSYGPSAISRQSNQLWDAVKFEVLTTSSDDDLANEGLQALKAIATSLSTGLTVHPPPTTALARYLKNVVSVCLDLLKEPQQKQAKPAGRILATIATSSPSAFSYAMQNSMPTLMLICTDSVGIAKQRALMEVLNLFLESTALVYRTWMDVAPPPALENPMEKHRDLLFEVYSQALMGSNRDETSLRTTAMKGLGQLCKIRKFLAESEIGMIVQYLDEVALDSDEKDELRDEALKNLREISQYRGKLIMEITFPAFMSRLPDSDDEVRESMPYIGTLEALAKLSTERPVFEVLLTRLLNKLDVILHSRCQPRAIDVADLPMGTSGPSYPRAILSTLLYVLQQKPHGSTTDTKTYYQRLVPRILTKTILPLVGQTNEGSTSLVLSDERVVDITGRLVGTIALELDSGEQRTIIDGLFNLFVSGESSCLITEHQGVVAEKFRPFEPGSDERQAGCSPIFAYILAASRKDVALPVESLSEFLQKNIALAEHPKSPAHRLAHLRIIGLLVNKWMSSASNMEQTRQITETLLQSITAEQEQPVSDLAGERLRIVFWIVKALLLRADQFGMEVTQKLVDLLSSQNYGAMASRGWSVLLGEDELLNKEHYAVVRMLAKQRAFSLCIPKLIEGFKCASSDSKPNYLIALSNILRNVPSSVIKPELTHLLPLLLQSIDLPDIEVKSATIETLHVTIRESADALQEHVSSVITRLLAACDIQKNPPQIRIAALRCLRSFPGALRTEFLLPYKRQVMIKLKPVLDDPKRIVRKEAVDCRAKWFALDEPEE